MKTCQFGGHILSCEYLKFLLWHWSNIKLAFLFFGGGGRGGVPNSYIFAGRFLGVIQQLS